MLQNNLSFQLISNMTFTLTNLQQLPVDLAKAFCIRKARQKIILYPMRANEIKLNRYMLKTYHLPLKVICVKLLNKAVFSTNFNGEIIKN